MSTPYKLHDLSMLGEPPWKPSDSRLQEWETAHGHDVRIDCDIRTCELAVAAYEACVEALERLLGPVEPDGIGDENQHWANHPEWPDDEPMLLGGTVGQLREYSALVRALRGEGA